MNGRWKGEEIQGIQRYDQIPHNRYEIGNGRVEQTRGLNSHSNYLCFTIHYRINDLVVWTDRVSKKQIITHKLISYLHSELGWGYRKITKKFNDEWKIKTHTGKKWGKTGNSVYSVLKRFKEREERLILVKKQYTIEIEDFRIQYLRN